MLACSHSLAIEEIMVREVGTAVSDGGFGSSLTDPEPPTSLGSCGALAAACEGPYDEMFK